MVCSRYHSRVVSKKALTVNCYTSGSSFGLPTHSKKLGHISKWYLSRESALVAKKCRCCTLEYTVHRYDV